MALVFALSRSTLTRMDGWMDGCVVLSVDQLDPEDEKLVKEVAELFVCFRLFGLPSNGSLQRLPVSETFICLRALQTHVSSPHSLTHSLTLKLFVAARSGAWREIQQVCTGRDWRVAAAAAAAAVAVIVVVVVVGSHISSAFPPPSPLQPTVLQCRTRLLARHPRQGEHPVNYT